MTTGVATYTGTPSAMSSKMDLVSFAILINKFISNIVQNTTSDVRREGRAFSGGGRAAPAGLVAGVDILGPAAAPRGPSPGVMAPRRCVQEQGKGILTCGSPSSEAVSTIEADGERERRAAGQVARQVGRRLQQAGPLK